jgi:hypothetical protein
MEKIKYVLYLTTTTITRELKVYLSVHENSRIYSGHTIHMPRAELS